MWFLWLLNIALLFVFETSVGDARGGAASVPANASIPGCGDAQTTPAAPEDQPKHYVVYRDGNGCEVKIIGTWMTTEDYNCLPDTFRKNRAPHGKVKLPASCKKTCGNAVQNLKDGTPCRKVFGDLGRRRNLIKNGCLVGACQSGLCVSGNRTISCYIPPNSTDTRATPGSFAE
uniref:Evasin n=1 Tax=Amblyomma americanum TaxID=6943 RepID=A0A0C9RXH9_AMBAM